MDLSELQAAVLEHIRQPNYQPVKLKVIAKKLGVAPGERPLLRQAVRLLVKAGQLNYAANHVVRRPDQVSGTTSARISRLPSESSGQTAPPIPTGSSAEIAFSGDEPFPASDPSGAIDFGGPHSERTASEKPAPGEPGPSRKTPRSKPAIQGSPGDEFLSRFRRTARGSGFARPHPTPRGHRREDDVYISAGDARDAATGDIVLVRLTGRYHARHGNRVGKLIKVIERDSRQFVGTYFEEEGLGWVNVDGGRFSEPIAVSDPGARSPQPGDKVVLEMIHFPTPRQFGEGALTEVLGARGTPGIDTLTVIREFDLPDEFAEDALQQAREQAETFEQLLQALDSGEIPEGRLDLTGETIITVDPRDARDFDDAISLKCSENGHWHLGVHIADVSYFVPPKTPLDREARNRGTSVYLPDRVLPMLPEIISNGLASLQPDRLRFAKSVLMEFSPEGQPIGCTWHNSIIRSCRRFAYEEVDEFLVGPEAFQQHCAPAVWALLRRMRDLSRLLRRRRAEAGKLELSLPEIRVQIAANGQVSGARVEKNTESHQIIEEFMLSANEAVAGRLAKRGIGFLRRVHEPPEEEKIALATQFVRELGFEVTNLQDRYELKALLEQVVDDPRAYAVNYAVLRSLKRAIYSPQEEGHFALNSPCYCHFTSPIRRYPDLTIHRLVTQSLAGKQPTGQSLELEVLGEHCSDRERRAEDAEQQLTKLKLLSYLQRQLGLELEGVITGVEDFGLFVRGIELPAEGRIHVSALPSDFYRLDRDSHTLMGYQANHIFRLGDFVRVAVAKVNLDRREVDFRFIRHRPHPKAIRIHSEHRPKAANGQTPTGRGGKRGDRNTNDRRRKRP